MISKSRNVLHHHNNIINLKKKSPPQGENYPVMEATMSYTSARPTCKSRNCRSYTTSNGKHKFFIFVF